MNEFERLKQADQRYEERTVKFTLEKNKAVEDVQRETSAKEKAENDRLERLFSEILNPLINGLNQSLTQGKGKVRDHNEMGKSYMEIKPKTRLLRLEWDERYEGEIHIIKQIDGSINLDGDLTVLGLTVKIGQPNWREQLINSLEKNIEHGAHVKRKSTAISTPGWEL